MRRRIVSICFCLAIVGLAWHIGSANCAADEYCSNGRMYGQYPGWGANVGPVCPCHHTGWDGKRRISYQQQKDLFYNYYAQPGPFYNTPSQMYVSPLPVPAHVGHTYTTYQPFMPHEYMYNHQRAYYTYNRGAGWTRTNVRYGTCCEPLRAFCGDWHYPMSNNIAALHNDFYHPGQRW